MAKRRKTFKRLQARQKAHDTVDKAGTKRPGSNKK